MYKTAFTVIFYYLVFLFWGYVFGLSSDELMPFTLIALVAGVVAILASANAGGDASHADEEREGKKRELERVRKFVEEHIDTLSRKRRSLTRKGDYGEIIDDGWRKEINRFAKLVLPDLLYMSLGGSNKGAGYRLESFIDRLVSENIESTGSTFSITDVSSLDGVEYEAFCAEILEKEGWKVQRTPASGDHGVDLIAEKPGRRVAIQCKKYSTPVGNKAVQEAYSGMNFFDANEAVVVTNSTFTKAANIAANKLSVALKHHDQLRSL